MANWYYLADEVQIGPIESGELRRLAASGAIGPDTLVWRSGLSDWVPAKQIRDLGFGTHADPPPPPPPATAARRPGSMQPRSSARPERAAPQDAEVGIRPPIESERHERPRRTEARRQSKRSFFSIGPAQWILLGVVTIGVAGFLLSFHIVRTDGAPVFIAKKSLTFKNTIVNLDDLIARWNSRSLREVLREDDAIEALVQELERRRLIRSSDSPDPSGESSPFAASTRALPEPPTRSPDADSTPAERSLPSSPSVPSSPSESSASASLLQPGSSVTTRSAEFKLASVRIDQRVRPTDPAAPTGKIFVIAIWSLTNHSNEPIPTTGYLGMVSEYFDGKGRKFAPDAMQSGMYGLGRDGWRDLLGPINPGDTIDQAAVFLVPTDAISGAHIRTGTLRFPGEREIRIAVPER